MHVYKSVYIYISTLPFRVEKFGLTLNPTYVHVYSGEPLTLYMYICRVKG